MKKKGLVKKAFRVLLPEKRPILSSVISAIFLSLLSILIFTAVASFNHHRSAKAVASFKPGQEAKSLSTSSPSESDAISSYEITLPEREVFQATLDTVLEEEDCKKINGLIRNLLSIQDGNTTSSSVESLHRSQASSFPITRHSVFLTSPQSLPALREVLHSHLGASCAMEESVLSKKRKLIQIFQYDRLCAEVLCIEVFEEVATLSLSPESDMESSDESDDGQATEDALEIEQEAYIQEEDFSEEQGKPEEMLVQLVDSPDSKDVEEAGQNFFPEEESPADEVLSPSATPESVQEQEPTVPSESTVEEVEETFPEEETENKIEEELRPLQPQKEKALLAIIIDDGGYFKEESERILALDFPLTLAILPDTPLGDYIASEGHARGFETILHMPMQAGNGGKNYFPGELNISMSAEEIQKRTRECFALYPHVVGVNNHTGGLFTSCREQMEHFMDVVRSEGKYFVDSVTTPKSTAFLVAIQKKVPAGKRDIFIDHDNTLSEVRRYFHKAVDHALQNGSCIAIGHFRKNTVTVLEQELPKLKNKGVRVVPVSELVW
jgi:polysaccharide deacetylase 2 family uncharacterized protein YibQ